MDIDISTEGAVSIFVVVPLTEDILEREVGVIYSSSL